MMGTKRRFAIACILGTVVGCGSSASPNDRTASPTPPAATDTPPANPPAAPPDHGAPSTTFPAFPPDVPQLRNNGGHVMTNPIAVTITWPGDPNAATFEQFGDELGTTSYWKDIVGEYGVGPITSGAANHVRLTTAPTIDPKQDPIQQLATWLQGQLANPAANGFPAPTDQHIYGMYLNGDLASRICNMGAGGLHEDILVGGKPVAFAIMNQCDPGPGAPFDELQETTVSASHEFAEASLDPFPNKQPGWAGVDGDHLGYELMVAGNDENADLCDAYEDSYGAYASPLAFFVERTWSNKSAAAGHSPCVPAPKDPYFNVTPLTTKDAINADFSALGGAPFAESSKGFPIKVGETKQIAFGIWSDGPTDDLQIDAHEVDPFDLSMGPPTGGGPSNPTLSVSLDKKSGKNGEKVYLSVTVNKSNGVGVQLVMLAASIGKTTRYLPIVVGGNKPDPAAQAALKKALQNGMRPARFNAATRLDAAARIASPGSARPGSTPSAAGRVFRARATLPRAI